MNLNGSFAGCNFIAASIPYGIAFTESITNYFFKAAFYCKLFYIPTRICVGLESTIDTVGFAKLLTKVRNIFLP